MFKNFAIVTIIEELNEFIVIITATQEELIEFVIKSLSLMGSYSGGVTAATVIEETLVPVAVIVVVVIRTITGADMLLSLNHHQEYVIFLIGFEGQFFDWLNLLHYFHFLFSLLLFVDLGHISSVRLL
jgi:hypothetical protein